MDNAQLLELIMQLRERIAVLEAKPPATTNQYITYSYPYPNVLPSTPSWTYPNNLPWCSSNETQVSTSYPSSVSDCVLRCSS